MNKRKMSYKKYLEWKALQLKVYPNTSPFNFKKVKNKRKMTKQSRKINRRK